MPLSILGELSDPPYHTSPRHGFESAALRPHGPNKQTCVFPFSKRGSTVIPTHTNAGLPFDVSLSVAQLQSSDGHMAVPAAATTRKLFTAPGVPKGNPAVTTRRSVGLCTNPFALANFNVSSNNVSKSDSK